MKKNILLLFILLMTSFSLISCKKESLEDDLSKEDFEIFKNNISDDLFIKASKIEEKTLGNSINKEYKKKEDNENNIDKLPTIEVFKEGDSIYKSLKNSIVILDENKKIVYVDLKSPLASNDIENVEELISSKILGDYKLYCKKDNRTNVYVKNDDLINLGSALIVEKTNTTINKIIKIRDVEETKMPEENLHTIEESKKALSSLKLFENADYLSEEILLTNSDMIRFLDGYSSQPGSVKFTNNLDNKNYFLTYRLAFKYLIENNNYEYVIVYTNPYNEEVYSWLSFVDINTNYPEFDFNRK